MAQIKKIKLKNGTYLELKDSRIPGIDSTPTSGSQNVVTSGGVYTAIQNAGGGGSANAQIRANSQAGATGEGDICPSQITLEDGVLSGGIDNIYTLSDLEQYLTISFSPTFDQYEETETEAVTISRWTGSDWEAVIDGKVYDDEPFFPDDDPSYVGSGFFFRDLINKTILNIDEEPVYLGDYFTPDTGDVAKIKLTGGFLDGELIFNVGANNATASVMAENFGGTFHQRRPALANVVQYSQQTLTSEQKAQARNNIGAMASNGAQKVIPYGDYSTRNEGDIYYGREMKTTGSDLVNTLNDDYLNYDLLKIAFVDSPSGSSGEVITIHDESTDTDIFTIEVDADEYDTWADIYDGDGEYYGYCDPTHPTVLVLTDYINDTLTITSTKQNSDITILQAYYNNVPYEMFGGTGYKRIPNVELVHDAVNLPTAQSTSSDLSSSFDGVFSRKFVSFSNDGYLHIPFIDFTDSETQEGDDYDVRHCIFEVGGYKYDVANHDYDGSWSCTVTASGGGGSATAITSQEIATIWTTVMG